MWLKDTMTIRSSLSQVKVGMLWNLEKSSNDKNVVLTNKCNNMRLIDILVESLKNLTLSKANRKLIVTGPDPVPFEDSDTGLQSRDDLKTGPNQEEADIIMFNQMLVMANHG